MIGKSAHPTGVLRANQAGGAEGAVPGSRPDEPASPAWALALLPWFEGHRRDLPWRRDPTPYHVLVSELMLQQTRVDTVVPYYERFLRRFPDFAHLAAASEEEVLRLWAGLGYYSRARHLWQAARQVVARYGGNLPPDRGVLLSLPGVGPYTAGAILSIAFNRPAAAVDGNTARVAGRLLALDATTARGHRELADRIEAAVPPGRARDFTQALMELGALVCLPPPQAPDCGRCPLAAWCLWCKSPQDRSSTGAAGARQPKPGPRVVPRAVLVVACGNRVLVRRRPSRGLLAGMWEFPGTDVREDGPRAAALRTALDLGNALGLGIAGGLGDGQNCGHLGSAEVDLQGPAVHYAHTFSHLRWEVDVYWAKLPPAPGILESTGMEGGAGPPTVLWLRAADLASQVPLPAAFRPVAAFARSLVEGGAPPGG